MIREGQLFLCVYYVKLHTLVAEGVPAAGYHDSVGEQVAAQAADEVVGDGGLGRRRRRRLRAHRALRRQVRLTGTTQTHRKPDTFI